MVDALVSSNGKARGLAAVKRSVRFNLAKRLVDFTPGEKLLKIASRVAPLGWHVVIYLEAVDLPELWDFSTPLPMTVVVDHMGRPDVSKGVGSAEFAFFASSNSSRIPVCGAPTSRIPSWKKSHAR